MSSQRKHLQWNNTRSESLQYLIAIGAILSVSLLSYIIKEEFGYQAISLILLFAVALLSLYVNVGPVLLSATLSALIWNFFFIPPHFTFAIGQPQDVLMFITYFVIAAITGILTIRIRIREQQATTLATLTKDLIHATSQDEVAESTVKTIGTVFKSSVIVYLSTIDGEMNTNSHPSSTYIANQKEFSVASWAYWNEKKAGKFIDILPFAECTYYPISGPRYPLGVVGVFFRTTKPITIEQEAMLQNILHQIASALEREQLNEIAKQTAAYTESEKLYKTLFNSISHELRTPIAAIISASESLSHKNQKEFTEEIHTAADRLNRLVENLLDMTRLESGQLAPKLDWCDVNDLFRASIQKLRKELEHHTVAVNISKTIPLVKLDFGLMEQAFTNLLYNASLYTPAGTAIDLTVKTDEKNCIFTVSDNGPGFPNETLNHLFEKFYRVPGSRTGGTGLGLSIVKGFIEAHKGTITAANNTAGGAEFVITIPTETHFPNV